MESFLFLFVRNNFKKCHQGAFVVKKDNNVFIKNQIVNWCNNESIFYLRGERNCEK